MTLKTDWVIGNTGHATAHNDIATQLNYYAADVIDIDSGGDIQAAITAAAGVKLIRLRRNVTYTVAQKINLRTGTLGPKIQGNGATIKAGVGTWKKGDAVMELTGGTTIKMSATDITIDANNLVDYGATLNTLTEPDSRIENIRVKGAVSHGWNLVGVQSVRLAGLIAQACGGDGFYLDGCNATQFDFIRSINHAGNGITLRGVTHGGGCLLLNPDVELNAGHGVYIQDTTSLVKVVGGWLEQNTGDGIRVSAKAVSLMGVHVTGVGSGSNYAIHILDTGSAAVIGCGVQRESGDLGYPVIKAEVGAILAAFGNYNMYSGAMF